MKGGAWADDDHEYFMGDAVADSWGVLRACGDVLVGDPPCGVAPLYFGASGLARC